MRIPEYLINEHYQDRYFDVVDAIAEAQYIYVENSQILKVGSDQTFIIGETGFGAGRVLIALMDALNKSSQSNLTISYYTVELHPLTPERMAAILDSFRTQVGSTAIDSLIDAYSHIDMTQPGWHLFCLSSNFGMVEVHLWLGEALEMVYALKELCHAWFLEGHGPKKNPSLWRYELLKAIADKTRIGGVCSSFTVSGPVRRALESLGFCVERPSGFGGKNVVLKATKTGELEKACHHGWEDIRVGYHQKNE